MASPSQYWTDPQGVIHAYPLGKKSAWCGAPIVGETNRSRRKWCDTCANKELTKGC